MIFMMSSRMPTYLANIVSLPSDSYILCTFIIHCLALKKTEEKKQDMKFAIPFFAVQLGNEVACLREKPFNIDGSNGSDAPCSTNYCVTFHILTFRHPL